MNDEVDMETILKRFALWGGIALAIVSIYFSYDGADQTINGGNPSYSDVGKVIMIVMAMTMTLAQFIFNSDLKNLNSTLKVLGILSYFYSMSTNYLGINHLFGFHGIVGWGIAVVMDVAPEAFIAWSLEDVTRGDLLGNLGKFVTGVGKRSKRSEKRESAYRSDTEHLPEPKPFQRYNTEKYGQAKKGQGRHILEAQRNKSEKPNRFNGFGE